MNPVFAPDEPLIEGEWPPRLRWPPRWQWPTDFRKFMFWIFGTTTLIFVADILYTIPRAHTIPLLRNVLIGPTFSIHVAAISGVAAWSIWKGKSWARGWAIAASVTYILMFFRQFIIPVRPAWDHHVGVLFVGLLGVVSFAWPDKPVKTSDSKCANTRFIRLFDK